jgi:hypothetical protein
MMYRNIQIADQLAIVYVCGQINPQFFYQWQWPVDSLEWPCLLLFFGTVSIIESKFLNAHMILLLQKPWKSWAYIKKNTTSNVRRFTSIAFTDFRFQRCSWCMRSRVVLVCFLMKSDQTDVWSYRYALLNPLIPIVTHSYVDPCTWPWHNIMICQSWHICPFMVAIVAT